MAVVTGDSLTSRTVAADFVSGRTAYGETFSFAAAGIDTTDLVFYSRFNADTHNAVNGTWGPDFGSTYFARSDNNGWVNDHVNVQSPGKFSDGVVLNDNSQANVDISDGDTNVDALWAAGDFTFSTWVMWNAATAANVRYVYLGGSTTGLRSPAGTSNLVFQARIATVTIDICTATSVIAADGNYHHIVGRRSGDTWTIWYDGVQVASATQSGSTDAWGGGQALIFSRINGRGDDFALWHRALTDLEIATIYNGGTGTEIIPG